MSKKNKNASGDVQPQVLNETDAKKQKPIKQEDKKGQQKKSKKAQPKEKGKIKKKAKETLSELKKVTWPTFGEVCKKTGVVLVVVLVFAVVIFGMDYGLGALMRLLTNK